MTSIRFHYHDEDLPANHALHGFDGHFIVSAYVSRYVPAKVYGDPGSCCPAEGGEIGDMEVVLADTLPVDLGQRGALEAAFLELIGEDWRLRESVEEELWEAAESEREALPDGWKDERSFRRCG